MRSPKVLIALLLAGGLVAAQAQEKLYLKVIYRDFNSYNPGKAAGQAQGHPDFEAFDAKYGDATTDPARCGSLGQPAFASNPGLASAYYSWFQQNYGTLDNQGPKIGTYYNWVTAQSRDVYPTLGMVQSTLSKTVPGEKYWESDLIDLEGQEIPVYKPSKARDACNNSRFDEWFYDVPGVNYRVEDELELQRIPGTNKYTLDYSHWHNPSTTPGTRGTPVTVDGLGNDFLPLDKYGNGNVTVGDVSVGELYGCQQTISYGSTGSDQALPRTQGCSQQGQQGYRNFGYTMESHLMFSYYGTGDEHFEFQGDDDLWIFIDGELAADVGGTHLPINANLNIQDYAASHGWAPNTLHRMDIFYAERQSNGANLKLTVSLNDLKVSEKLGPQVTSARVSDGSDPVVWVYLNTRLHQEVLNNINNGVFHDAFLIKRAGSEVVFNINAIEEETTVGAEKRKGYKYKLTFVTGEGTIWPNSSDSISVNPVANGGDPLDAAGDGLKLGVDAWMYGANGKVSDAKVFKRFDLVSAEGGGNVKPIEQPKSAENIPFGGGTSGLGGDAGNGAAIVDWLKANGHTFDSEGKLDVNKGGELIFTVLDPDDPAFAGKSSDEVLALFQGDPSFYIVNPGSGLKANQAFINGVATGSASNGFRTSADAGSDSRSEPLCRASMKNGAMSNSCLPIAFLTKGPFRMNVRVFDHMGNFVQRYSQEVTEEQIHQIQGLTNPTPLAAGMCDENAARETGADTKIGVKSPNVLSTINIYPFSETGRLLATGVYIVQVDILQKHNAWCELTPDGTRADVKETPGNRSSMVLRLPYRHP